MEAPLDHKFIQQVNQNIGIARKVREIYFTGSDEREDVLQEMMYQLWRSFPNFKANAKFSTWMYRVCLNTALTYLRKSKRNKNEAIIPEHHLISVNADNQHENTAMLYKAIEGLSAVNKSIILLYLEDMSYEEIADVTGLSKSNISVRLVRIKKDIEAQIRKKTNITEDGKH